MGGSKGQGEFKQLHPGLTFIGVLGGHQQSLGLGRDRKKGVKVGNQQEDAGDGK